MARIKVNIISGALGAGKTTLIRNLIQQKPQHEQWAILVNEFGAIGIDGAILDNNSDQLIIKQMPGGCICCTAQVELKSALTALLNSIKPKRIIIEPTGLSEPDSLVDLLKTPEFNNAFEIQTIFSVFDIANTAIDELKDMTIMQSLLSMADIIVLNKQDIATKQQTETLLNFCNNLYPPKQSIVITQNSMIDYQLLFLHHNFISAFNPVKQSQSSFSMHHDLSNEDQAITTKLPYPPLDLPGLQTRQFKQQLDTTSIGWVFKDTITFNWQDLLSLFQTLTHSPVVKRGKGVFRVGEPRMLFQYTHGKITREYIAYRKDSRLELLLENNTSFNFIDFEGALLKCIKTKA